MTANDLIKLVLKQIGVVGIGQTPNSEDVNDAKSVLNLMLGDWNAQRWLVYVLDTLSIDSVAGQVSYTVGSGGDFDITPAPTMVDYAYCTMPPQGSAQPVDFPLRIIKAREDYDAIALKQLSTWPSYAYYETSYPIGKLYCWPVPGAGFKIQISYKTKLTSVDNLADELNFAEHYQNALYWNLCARLIPMYKMQPDPTVTAMAESGLNTIRTNNFQIPMARPDRMLIAGHPGVYNIYSDGYSR